MLFNSLQFLVFLPVVCVLYYLLPKRIRYIWLLICSYYFYMCWNAEYAVLILISTVVTYVSGLLLDMLASMPERSAPLRKCVVAGSFIINLGILAYFKYTGFALSLIEAISSFIGVELNVPAFDIVLPVGISFYTFQALSYTMDVYRGEIYAERNILKYALFVSFFPQLVAGPIERSKNLLKQLNISKDFSVVRLREGVLLMLWGYYLKVVVADRIAIFVDTVYGDITTYSGMYLFVATVLFAFQIYCDFYGYSVIAKGIAHIFGIELMENFDAPYISVNVSQFWRKWHISLTSWFKDYLYIPLGGSRKGKIRKYINKMIVFLVSGLWHGAEMSYVVWGGLNGAYQVIGEMITDLKRYIQGKLTVGKSSVDALHESVANQSKSVTSENKLHAGKYNLLIRVLQCFITFILIDISWIFFRASTVNEAIEVVASILTMNNVSVLFDGSLVLCGLDCYNFIFMIISILILFVADVLKTKKISITGRINASNYAARSAIMIVAAIFILIFGIYGLAYDQTSFIYFQF